MRIVLLGCALLVALAAAGTAWLFGTEAGARFALDKVAAFAPVAIETRGLSGTLAGPLRADSLAVRAPGVSVGAGRLEVDWSPLALVLGRVRVERLHVASLDVEVTRGEERAADVEDGAAGREIPAAPFPVRLDELSVARAEVRIDGRAVLSGARLALSGSASGRALDVERLLLEAREASISGHARLSADPDEDWSVRLDWRVGAEDGRLLRGRTQLDGRLRALALDQSVSGLVAGRIEGEVRGLPGRPSADLELALEPLPPGEGPWPDVLDGAGGSLRISGAPEKARITGTIEVPAVAAGPVELDWSGSWDEGVLTAAPLSLAFANGGQARIEGRLSPAQAWALEATLEGTGLGWPLGGPDPTVPVPSIALTAGGDAAELRFDARGRAGYDFLPVSRVETRGAWRGSIVEFGQLRVDAPDERLSAAGSGALDFGGERLAYRFDLQGSGEIARWPPVQATLAGRGDTAGLVIERLQAKTLDGVVDAQGEVGWAGSRTTDLRARLRGIDPSHFAPDFPGSVTADVTLTGTAPRVTLTVDGLDGRLRGQPLAGRGRLTIAPGDYRLTGLALSLGSARLTAAGGWGRQVDLDARLDVAELGDVLENGAGRLEAEVSARGPATAPMLTARVDAGDVSWGDWRAASASAEAGVDLSWDEPSRVVVTVDGIAAGAEAVARSLDATLAGTRARHRLDAEVVRGDHRLSLVAGGGIDGAAWAGELARLDLVDDEGPVWGLDGPAPVKVGAGRVSLDEACMDGRVGRACLEGAWRRDGAWEGVLELAGIDLEGLTTWFDMGYVARGTLSGGARAEATDQAFTRLSGRFELGEGSVFDPAEPEPPLQSWDGATLELTGDRAAARADLSVDFAEDDTVEASARVAWNDPELPLSGWARARVDALRILAEVVPDLAGLEGEMRADLDIGGTLRSPQLTGSVVLEDGSAQIPALGIHPRAIQARADFSGREVGVSVSAESGGGRLEISGNVEFDRRGDPVGRLHMTGTEVLLVDIPEARLFTSPDLEFTYRGEELRVRGDVAIPRGRLTGVIETGAIMPSPDEVIVGEQEKTDGRAIFSRVRVSVGPDVNVSLRGLEGRLEGEVLTIVDPPALPSGQGELRFLDGSLTVFGQRLEIERGAIIYTGGPLADPAIDVRAVREVGGVRAGALARGPIREPTITLVSSPPMSRAETLSYLITGKPISELRTSESADVSRAATSLALAGGSLVAGEVGERIGVDELGFEGDDETGNTSLVIGKYLSPQLYVSYGVGLLEAVNVLRIRYRLSSRLSVEVATSDESSADIIYTFDRE